MGIQYISCILKVKRSCGCFEDVNYSGIRSRQAFDTFILKQENNKCTNCYESEIRKIRGL
jgi:hypothetical protein